MANKDVELRIRARDYSQKTFKDLISTYTALTKVQEEQAKAAEQGEGSARDLEKTYDRLADVGKQLLKLDALTNTFENQGKALDEAKAKTDAARQKLAGLVAEYDKAETKTKKAENAIIAATKAVERMSNAETKRQDILARTSAELTRYGISTEQVKDSQAQFAASVNTINAALERQDKVMTDLAGNKAMATANAAAKKQADEADANSRKVVEGLQRQADQALATARGYKTLGRVVNTVATDSKAVGSAVQTIIAPAEQARTTVDGLARQVEDLADAAKQADKPLSEMKADIKELAAAQQRIVAVAGLVDQFRNQAAAVRAARTEYNAAKAEVRDLAQQLSVAGADVSGLGAQLAAAQQRLAAAAKSMDQLGNAAKRSQAALRQAGIDTRNLAEAEAKLVTAADKSVAAAKKSAAAIREQGTAAKTTTPLMEGFAASGRESLSLFQRIRGEVIALATAYVGLQGTLNLASGSIDAYKLRQQTLIKIGTAVGQSQAAQNAEWEYMIGLADKLGIQIETLAPSYSKFAVSARAAGMTMEETKFIFESFAKSAAVLQLSAADMEGTFRAIEQVISKGQVYAEELRGQLGERLPGAVSLFAEATGRSIAELNKALEGGQVSSREIINFAAANAERIDAQLAAADKSVSAAENRLKNTQVMFKLAIADAGFIDAYANALNKITEFLKSEDGKELAKGIAQAFSELADAVVWTVENLDTVKRVIVAILGLQAAKYVVGLVSNIMSLVSWVGRGFAALTAFRVSLLAGATGVGTATTAVTVLRVALSTLLRFIPIVGAAILAFEIGSWLYENTEIGRKAIDTLINAFKMIPDVIKALFLSVPALTHDLMKGINKAIVDGIGEDSFTEFKDELSALLSLVPGIGQSMATVVSKSGDAMVDSSKTTSNELGKVWGQMGTDWAKLQGNMEQVDREKYARMINEANAFARKIKESTGINVPGASTPVSPMRPEAPAAFQFTQDPGTGVTKRDQDIAALTKTLEKAEEAAKKTNKATRELEMRQSLTGRIALIDEEFKGLLTTAKEIGDPALLARVQALVALRKEAETREFNVQQGKRDDDRAARVQNLTEEYNKLNAAVERKAATIDPSASFLDRQKAVLTEMSAKYDELINKAKALGGTEGKALQDKLEKLRDANGEYLKEKTKIEELGRLQDVVNSQMAIRKSLIEEQNALREAGLISEDELVKRVIAINTEMNGNITTALANLQAFVETIRASLTPEQFAAINAQIAQMGAGLKNVNGTYTKMDTMVVDGVLGAMDGALENVKNSLVSVAQGTMTWGDALKSLGATVAQFFADFLMQIAKAILQQMILNAISGGTSSMANAAASMGGTAKHNGGMVGDFTSGSGIQSRSVSPSWFAGAPRFHSGGFPGLRSDEIPTILQKGEQVLSKDDPNNALNAKPASMAPMAPNNTTIINAIDSSSVVAEGAATPAGQRAIINMIKANRSTIKSVLG